MAEVVGVVAAAEQFLEVTVKLVRFIQDVHAETKAEPTKLRLIQLETWAEVAEKIRDTGEQNDPLTEKIMKQCIPIVEALASLFGLVQISVSDDVFRKIRKGISAQQKKERIADLYAQLHRNQMALLTHRSFASEDRLLQRMIERMGSLLDDRLKYAEEANQSTREADFLKAIFVTDPRDDRSALVHRKSPRAEGTCTWITKTDQFLHWLTTAAPSSPGLVIEGGPGKGKSMIAIYLTEYLENLAQTSEAGTESVIYFFCDNRNIDQNSALAVIRCLVWQLCRLRPSLLHYGAKELEARGDANQLLEPPAVAIETLWRVFISMLSDDRAGTVSCVIDGLDECDEASILSVLTKFHDFSTGHQTLRSKFKFIILSRPLSLQCQRLNSHIPKVCLDPDLNEGDITVFIEQRVNELALANPRKPWRNSLVEKVKTTLLEKAGGTFLWVGFVTDELRGKLVFEVKPCLQALPQGLNGIYDRIMLSMPRIHWFKIRSLLHWMCLAPHPLHMIKLAGLLHDETVDAGTSDTTTNTASDSDSNSISDTEPGMDELKGLLHYCDDIVKIDKNAYVHFVHQSAKDYLMRTDVVDKPDLEYFRVGDLQHAHEKLALRCIEIIESQAEPLEAATDEPHGQLMERSYSGSSLGSNFSRWMRLHYRGWNSFDYAAGFWVHHAREIDRDGQDMATAEGILRLLDNANWRKPAWLSVYHTIHLSDRDTRRSHNKASGLRLAMMLGLGATTRQLIQSMSIEDYVSTSMNGYPRLIECALASNPTQILRVLLDRYGNEILSADADQYGNEIHSADAGALFTAAASGLSDAVKMLLALGPSPREVHGEDLEMALNEASKDPQNAGIMIELLRAGADPTDGTWWTRYGHPLIPVLRWTTDDHHNFNGEIDRQVEVVRLMLQRGAGADIQTTHYLDSGATMLHLVAARHNHSVASLLLEWGVPINAVDSNGATPLHYAADEPGKDPRICEVLIAAGQRTVMKNIPDAGPQTGIWHIDSRNLKGQSALLLACRSAWPEAIEHLLQAGANPNLRDNDGRGTIDLVLHRLLDEWTEMEDEADPPKWTFGWKDRSRRCIACLDVLGAAVADCNEQNAHGGTVLHTLAYLMEQFVLTPEWEVKKYRPGLKALKVLRNIGIDENVKDKAGKVARDYYPRDVFWRTEDDPLVSDSRDQTSDENDDD